MNDKMISIIVPCYNQQHFIIECLESVSVQTYKNWECIVINDGSTDNSLDLINQFCLNKSNFKVISQKNSGVAVARNNGVFKAKGKYILPLDGDDKIGATYLEKAIVSFQKNKEIKLVYCQARFFGQVDKKWKLPTYNYNDLLLDNLIFNAAIFKKQDFVQTSGYDPKLIYGYEDWDFWIQLLDKDSLVHRIDEELFYYRQVPNSRDKFKDDSDKYNYTMNYLSQKHDPKYRVLLELVSRNHIELLRDLKKLKKRNMQFKMVKKSISYKLFYKVERFITLKNK